MTMRKTIDLARPALRRCGHWAREVRGYWRECEHPRDFVSLMRVRLSQSKLGPWITPEPIVVDVNLKRLGRGVRLRSHTTDVSVLAEIVLGASIGHLPPAARTDTVIDLGANIGLAYRWLRHLYPSARFVCVEPDRGNLDVLRANVRTAEGHCHVIGACVGGAERKVRLATTDGEWGFRMVDVDQAEGADTDVVTMERILTEAGIERIGMLKCDIEGAEGELFADCRTWINRVDTMVVECHLDVTDTQSLVETLAANGAAFDVMHVDRNPELGFEIATLQRRDLAAAA
jgi:FkbM family methyltransferase